MVGYDTMRSYGESCLLSMDAVILTWMLSVAGSSPRPSATMCSSLLVFVFLHAFSSTADLVLATLVRSRNHLSKCGRRVARSTAPVMYTCANWSYLWCAVWGIFLFPAAAYDGSGCDPRLFYTAVGAWWWNLWKNFILVPLVVNDDIEAYYRNFDGQRQNPFSPVERHQEPLVAVL
eukprot:TRINITY_DN25643_c0_g1_i3.p1 TRINITY_DN25643_c0_g1~~TRINITY_DN25643_c0_g1_i3.p1  ORF type:complete len:176 (-),score=8.14 TRINITY_DN25643_c0_g1_i3:332-859(-)